MDIQGFLKEFAEKGELHTWTYYCEKYGLPTSTSNEARTCKRFLKRAGRLKSNLILTKETRRGKTVTGRVYGRIPEPSPTDGEAYQYTTSPYGGAWVRHVRIPGFTDDDIAALSERLSGPIELPKYPAPGGVICVDVADLHTGAVSVHMAETVRTPGFNSRILADRLDATAAAINAMNGAEVHLFFPGDLIESFTAFNHRDTWRNVEYHSGGVVVAAYSVLRRFLLSVNNVKGCYFVEGNHDRFTEKKAGNSRKGVVEVLTFFLQEAGIPVVYHPALVSVEIAGVMHLMTHGDLKLQSVNDFLFKYGSQGKYNILRSGHFHAFTVRKHTTNYLWYQCPSIFTGNFFSESIGYEGDPYFTAVEMVGGKPLLRLVPIIV